MATVSVVFKVWDLNHKLNAFLCYFANIKAHKWWQKGTDWSLRSNAPTLRLNQYFAQTYTHTHTHSSPVTSSELMLCANFLFANPSLGPDFSAPVFTKPDEYTWEQNNNNKKKPSIVELTMLNLKSVWPSVVRLAKDGRACPVTFTRFHRGRT